MNYYQFLDGIYKIMCNSVLAKWLLKHVYYTSDEVDQMKLVESVHWLMNNTHYLRQHILLLLTY